MGEMEGFVRKRDFSGVSHVFMTFPGNECIMPALYIISKSYAVEIMDSSQAMTAKQKLELSEN